MMTKEQGQELFQFLQCFCIDNNGNRLNEWLIEAFLSRAWKKIQEICDQNSSQLRPNDAQTRK